MNCLLDTGVLLRMYKRDDPDRPLIRQAIANLVLKDVKLYVSIQNVAEFWNVCTRPMEARGGLGWTRESTDYKLQLIEKIATLVSESEDSYLKWKQLVFSLKIKGVKVHDARLVSVMMSLGITNILTLNDADFQRYADIRALTPAMLIADDTLIN